MTRSRTPLLLAALALSAAASCSGGATTAAPSVDPAAATGPVATSSDGPPPPLTLTPPAPGGGSSATAPAGTDTAVLDPCALLTPEELTALELTGPGVPTPDYGRSCGWNTRGLGLIVALDAQPTEQAAVEQFGAATPRVLWGREGRRYPTQDFCSYFFTLANGSVLAILAGAPDGPRCLQAEEAARYVLPRVV